MRPIDGDAIKAAFQKKKQRAHEKSMRHLHDNPGLFEKYSKIESRCEYVLAVVGSWPAISDLWIDADEHLPELLEPTGDEFFYQRSLRVLGYDAYSGKMEVVTYEEDMDEPYWKGFVTEDGVELNVTHWMPIPLPKRQATPGGSNERHGSRR